MSPLKRSYLLVLGLAVGTASGCSSSDDPYQPGIADPNELPDFEFLVGSDGQFLIDQNGVPITVPTARPLPAGAGNSKPSSSVPDPPPSPALCQLLIDSGNADEAALKGC